MLSLESPRWAELVHAYGNAGDVPALLRELRKLPSSEDDSEPWFTLWSALAHQGDVYSASFAAVPYVINAPALEPSKADSSYFEFPAWVEICRSKNQIEVPEDLKAAYFDSLARLPALVSAAANRSWEADFLVCALAAVAVAKGQPVVAEAILELAPEVAREFLEWNSGR